MNRGDIVIVEFPYVDGGRGKLRPALIVQNDRDNARLADYHPVYKTTWM